MLAVDAQHQRRHRPARSCRGASTTRRIPIVGLALAIAAVLVLAWRADSMTLLGVRGAAVPDRRRLRLHAAARRHRAAEQRVDPHLRLGGRAPCSSRATCSPPCWSRCSACWCWPASSVAGGERGRPVFGRRLRAGVPRGRRELRGLADRRGPAGGKAAADRARLGAARAGFALSSSRRSRDKTAPARMATPRMARRERHDCDRGRDCARRCARVASARDRQPRAARNIPTGRSRSWSALPPAAAPMWPRA